MRAGRRHKEPAGGQDPGDSRDEFRRDHDRLYYTPAFRRLTGVTQVAAPQSELELIHNRYVHSDKVAQLGRSVAEYVRRGVSEDDLNAVGGIEPDVVAAAALAHDIGHPPFGHSGEVAFHKLAVAWGLDGFEGNAQTFRILTKLAVKDETFNGLDLTRATRNAVLKYPWTYGEGPGPELQARHSKKWCVYRTEVPDFNEARSVHVLPPRPSGEASQSVEASLMELADDISYALHDFEDFYRTGLISVPALQRADDTGLLPLILDQVQHSLGDRFVHGRANDAWETVTGWLENPVVAVLQEPYRGSREQDAALVRLTSYQISHFIQGVSLQPGMEAPLQVESLIEHEIAIWKQMTRQFVVNSPGFGAVQTGQQRVVRETAEHLREWIDDEGIRSPRLPQRLRDYYAIGLSDRDDPDHPNTDNDNVTARALLDYLASLTEPQVLALHEQLAGTWRASMIRGGIL